MGNPDAAFKKALRTVWGASVSGSTVCEWQRRLQPTLVLWIAIIVVETPSLRHKGAQIVVVWVVLPGSPIGGPIEFRGESTHARVAICINDSTAGHHARCAL